MDWMELDLAKHGFRGYFREGTRHADKAIICMSGSDGSKDVALASADVFLDEGYSVLVLGFIKWEGLPQDTCLVPVEYVENAVKWLLSHPSGKIRKVGIKGTSMGALYALLCASLIPELSCVIAASPFDHVMESVTDKLKRSGHSSFTYRGEEVAYSPSTLLDRNIPGLLWQCATDRHYGLRRALRFYYDKNPLLTASRVKVENMKADVLLLASANDDCWPAEESADRIEKILMRHNYAYRVKKVIYPMGSHAIGSMLRNGAARKKITGMLPAEKKHPSQCEAARQDSVRQIADFLDKWE